jgi:hypothetical protein
MRLKIPLGWGRIGETSRFGEGTMADYEAYCVKCKAKRMMRDAQVVTNKQGRRQAKGICPQCGTKMNLFLKSQ